MKSPKEKHIEAVAEEIYNSLHEQKKARGITTPVWKAAQAVIRGEYYNAAKVVVDMLENGGAQPSLETGNFSRDHWSTLVFVETRCVDYKGILDKDKMRCNVNRHAASAGPHQQQSFLMKSEPKNGTRLSTGVVLPDHDDWDCLIDLAKAGLITILDIDERAVAMTDFW